MPYVQLTCSVFPRPTDEERELTEFPPKQVKKESLKDDCGNCSNLNSCRTSEPILLGRDIHNYSLTYFVAAQCFSFILTQMYLLLPHNTFSSSNTVANTCMLNMYSIISDVFPCLAKARHKINVLNNNIIMYSSYSLLPKVRAHELRANTIIIRSLSLHSSSVLYYY